MSERVEARRLLAIARDRLDETPRQPVDPPRFLALAREADVAPWLHAALEKRGRLDVVGSEVADGLAASRRKCRNDNLLLLARLEQALDLLLSEGISPIALKGVDFLHRFHSGFDERTLDDADLLVAPADAERAVDALERAGWTAPSGEARRHWLRSSFEMPMESPGPVKVALEIHWSLGQERRYAVPVEAILARAVPTEIAGRTIRRLDDHDAAAHLLLHHLQHYFDRRLKWAIDLRSVAGGPGFSWETALERAAGWGGSAAAALSLVHLRKLFPGEFPEPRVAAWRRIVTLPLRSSHPLDLYRGTRRRFVQLWIAAAGLERASDLPGYLLHRATRDRD